jgi:hypothetical protein
MGVPLRVIPAGPMSTPPTPKPSARSACWSPARRATAGCACAAGWSTSTAWRSRTLVGPRVMDERLAADFRGSCFAAYQARPLETPLGLAQHLVFGAVEYARALGSSPSGLCGDQRPTRVVGGSERHQVRTRRQALPRREPARRRRRRPADAGAFRRARQLHLPGPGIAASGAGGRDGRTAESACRLRNAASQAAAPGRTRRSVPTPCGRTPDRAGRHPVDAARDPGRGAAAGPGARRAPTRQA